MQLDLNTLQIVLGLVFIVNTLFSLIFLFARQHFRGVFQWILAQLLLALASVLQVLRADLPPTFSIGLGNTAFFAAIVCYAHTAWVLRFRRKFPRWIYFSVPLVFLLFSVLINASLNLRVVLFSALMGPAALSVFLLLVWRVRREARFAGWVTGLPFACVGFLNLFRIPDALISPSSTLVLIGDGKVGSTVYLAAILTASLSLYGYFLLASARFEYRLIRKESLIRRQLSRLRELNHTKDVFFSIIAHDLRGPVGGAARYVQKHLLKARGTLEQKREAIQTLADSLQRTNTFLENLLWWARSQRSDWQPKRVVVDIAELTVEAMRASLEFAADKEIEIEFIGDSFHVEAEPVSVRLIIQNLLSNAIKFSHRRSLIRLATSYDRGQAVVSVIDQGIGMDPDYVATLFKIDRKTTTHGTEGEFGTGLGLILCRSFADRNRAQLQIKSQVGVGTTAELRMNIVASPRTSS